MPKKHKNHEQVLAALRANPEPLIEWAADTFAYLGAKAEWSMEQNFNTTEAFAELAGEYDLPEASDQSDEALEFWGAIARDIGYDYDSESA